MSMLKGLYRHNATGKVYNVLGVGRAVENPAKLLVVYEQMQRGKLWGTNIVLEPGTIWTRAFEDFNKETNGKSKFVKLDGQLFHE